MFDKIFNRNNEATEMRKAENRQMNFAREQNVFAAASDPANEQTYIENQQMKSDLLKWQQDLDDEMIKLIHTLKGEELIEDSWIKTGECLCNDLFIKEVIKPQCSPFMSRNMINTNFNEGQILDDLRNTSDDIADAMSDSHDRYDIKFQNFDLVMRNIKNTIKSGGFRALNGWTKKIDSTVIKRIEASHELANQLPRKKLLGIF